MTYIEKLHSEGMYFVDSTKSEESRKYYKIKKSAEITENIACEFVDWLTKIEAYSCINKEFNGLWVMHPQDPKNYTPKELFQEYLKSKENEQKKAG